MFHRLNFILERILGSRAGASCLMLSVPVENIHCPSHNARVARHSAPCATMECRIGPSRQLYAVIYIYTIPSGVPIVDVLFRLHLCQGRHSPYSIPSPFFRPFAGKSACKPRLLYRSSTQACRGGQSKNRFSGSSEAAKKRYHPQKFSKYGDESA